MKVRGFIVGSFLTAVLALTACGGGSTTAAPTAKSGGSGATSAAATAKSGGATTGAATSGETLSIAATKDVKYDKTELSASANKPFKVKFTNNGGVDHNFVIKRPGGTDIAVPGPTKETYLGDGKSATSADITLPAGTYEFYCSFPGHEALMHGNVVVK
ncbi:MAG: hypothetical protein NVS4B8_19500 [Herpetosiphon sp.]